MSLELNLQAVPGNWRRYMARRADPAFQRFQRKVWQRDRYTCRYCGFQAKVYQDVVNLDGDYYNNKLSNLVTACCLCAQCLFLDSVGMADYGGGTLVYLPELTQTQLNSFCHVAFCAIGNDTGYKSSAQLLYRGFKFRSQIIEDRYGEGLSNPATFGQMMIELGINDAQTTDKIFNNMRLLPSRAKFRVQIEAWAQSALEEIGATALPEPK